MQRFMAFSGGLAASAIVGLVLLAPAADAAFPDIQVLTEEPALRCGMTAPDQAALTARLDALSERYYLAALEAMDHPEFFERVKEETRSALMVLQEEAGKDCWPLILGTRN